MNKMRSILSHLGVALSLSVLTLTFLEARNPSMGFLTSGWSAIYIVALCALCIYFSLSADRVKGDAPRPGTEERARDRRPRP